MHCPHKSVNQTSLSWCYWCLAATGVPSPASQLQTGLAILDSRSLMNQDGHALNRQFYHFEGKRSIRARLLIQRGKEHGERRTRFATTIQHDLSR